MTYTIYKITHIPSGRVYVGQTQQAAQERWNVHKRTAKCVKSKQLNITRAIREHGVEAFTFEVIEEGLSRRKAMVCECHWEAHYRALPAGVYNLNKGGNVMSAKTRAKMSAVRRGRVASLEQFTAFREAGPAANRGRKISFEHRLKLIHKATEQWARIREQKRAALNIEGT